MEYLYNYFFHFNHHKERWFAIPKEFTREYADSNDFAELLLNDVNLERLMKKIKHGEDTKKGSEGELVEY